MNFIPQNLLSPAVLEAVSERPARDLADSIFEDRWCGEGSFSDPHGILPAEPGQIEFLPRILNGSQAKTAFALRMNAERMIKEGGLASTGFMTITAGDYENYNENTKPEAWGRFTPCQDAALASKRINSLNRRVLPDVFEMAILVTERHKNNGIHFHILGILAGRPDIRTGFNHEAVDRRDYRTAGEHIRGIWAFLRGILPKYGFGARVELKPVKKTGAAVASYVSKYIEKNVCNRTADDKYKKLVRYLGWNKTQLKPNEFGWAGPKAVAWRLKTRQAARLCEITEPEHAYAALGPRWAFKLTKLWQAVCGDNLIPRLEMDAKTENLLRDQLRNECRSWFARKNRTILGCMHAAWDWEGHRTQLRQQPEPIVHQCHGKYEWLEVDSIYKNKGRPPSNIQSVELN